MILSPEIQKFIGEELTPLSEKLEIQLGEELNKLNKRNQSKNNFSKNQNDLSEEDYYRIIGKVYKYAYISKNFKDMVYVYKHPKTELKVKKQLKDLIINCNTALILNTMGKLLADKENDQDVQTTRGELIAEGYQTLTGALEKYEVDFTHEKSTKSVKIKLGGINNEGIIVKIQSNKPFGNLDITIKNTDLGEEESIQRDIEWTEQDELYTTSHFISFDDLENNYEEINPRFIKLSVSKKVGHPSTFFTNSIFFALKNYIIKNQLISINSNSYILKKQIQKIAHLYELQFGKEPSTRWISFYLLTQNNEIQKINDKQLLNYKKYLENKKGTFIDKDLFEDIEMVIKEEKNDNLVLLKNKTTKRLLMMKNKSATAKNKQTFNTLSTHISGKEDKQIYGVLFEKKIQKKIKEIEKVKNHNSFVDSLDREIGDGEGGTSRLGDMIGDNSFEIETVRDFDNNIYKKQLDEMALKNLSPKEYFYYNLYYNSKLNLKDLGSLGFYQNDSITDVKLVIRKALTKISFFTQYKNYINSLN